MSVILDLSGLKSAVVTACPASPEPDGATSASAATTAGTATAVTAVTAVTAGGVRTATATATASPFGRVQPEAQPITPNLCTIPQLVRLSAIPRYIWRTLVADKRIRVVWTGAPGRRGRYLIDRRDADAAIASMTRERQQ